MSIKGKSKELYVGKTESNVIDFWGNKKNIPYENLKRIDYRFANAKVSGYLSFVKRTNEEIRFEFDQSANDPILKTIDLIREYARELPLNEIDVASGPVQMSALSSATTVQTAPAPTVQNQTFLGEFSKNESSKGLKCPICKSHNIDLWSNAANYKIKQQTSVNLNPLKPLTILDTKTVKKEKKSAAKIGLGIMTGGTSLLFTGTKKKAHNEYYCKDCGHRWIGK